MLTFFFLKVTYQKCLSVHAKKKKKSHLYKVYCIKKLFGPFFMNLFFFYL